jgi:hypothetical protein
VVIFDGKEKTSKRGDISLHAMLLAALNCRSVAAEPVNGIIYKSIVTREGGEKRRKN